MPGTRPRTIGSATRRAAGRLPRFDATTHTFIPNSTRTKAGLSILLGKNSSATGTVIDENPYPRAPLTAAAGNAIAKRITIPRSRPNTIVLRLRLSPDLALHSLAQ